jgi:hypothetical protein
MHWIHWIHWIQGGYYPSLPTYLLSNAGNRDISSRCLVDSSANSLYIPLFKLFHTVFNIKFCTHGLSVQCFSQSSWTPACSTILRENYWKLCTFTQGIHKERCVQQIDLAAINIDQVQFRYFPRCSIIGSTHRSVKEISILSLNFMILRHTL